ncbi:MAG TPA: hypothetical protein VEF05_15420 [Terriglobales bacterium]|nr:hypothetical protein [Terriglobales bacterium]
MSVPDLPTREDILIAVQHGPEAVIALVDRLVNQIRELQGRPQDQTQANAQSRRKPFHEKPIRAGSVP